MRLAVYEFKLNGYNIILILFLRKKKISTICFTDLDQGSEILRKFMPKSMKHTVGFHGKYRRFQVKQILF
jgi:hypothetical protein